MNIAMMTSWGMPCGISEFSSRLVHELQHLGDKVYVLANVGADEDRTNYVFPDAFRVESWGETRDRAHSINIDKVLNYMAYAEAEVLHIQFQQTFFTVKDMEKLIASVPVPTVVTFHDNFALPSKSPLYKMAYVHRLEMLSQIPNSIYIELPYEVHSPTVFVYGLGRNRLDDIEEACDNAGVIVDLHDHHKDGWLGEHQLHYRIRMADAVVCWYNDIPMLHDYGITRAAVAGSAAVRTALGLYRPVLVNESNWFSDIDDDMVIKFGNSVADLENALFNVFHLEHIRERSYQEYAKVMSANYKRL